MGVTAAYRPVWAEIDLDAVRANVRVLRDLVAPATLLAVVKADGYGHGDLPSARAALGAGASRLGVALVEEGVRLREQGIDAPVLVLSEVPRGAEPDALAHRLTPTVATPEGLAALKEKLPHADFSKFQSNPEITKVAEVFTVDALVNFVERKLARQG